MRMLRQKAKSIVMSLKKKRGGDTPGSMRHSGACLGVTKVHCRASLSSAPGRDVTPCL